MNYKLGVAETSQLCGMGVCLEKLAAAPGLAAVNKRLSALKPCTQPARAAFNPAPMVKLRCDAFERSFMSVTEAVPISSGAGMRDSYAHENELELKRWYFALAHYNFVCSPRGRVNVRAIRQCDPKTILLDFTSNE